MKETGHPVPAVNELRKVRDLAVELLGVDEPFHVRTANEYCGNAEGMAGDLEAAERDLQAALHSIEQHRPNDLSVAPTLDQLAEVWMDQGKRDKVAAALVRARAIRERAGSPANRLNSVLRVQLAVDAGRIEEARTLFADELVKATPQANALTSIRDDLLAARIEIADGDNAKAVELASRALAHARTSGLEKDIALVIAEAQLLQGTAHLHAGDASAALPLLRDALAMREERLLPISPKIAEVALPLGDALRALHQPRDADVAFAKARVVSDAHPSLASRYLPTVAIVHGARRNAHASGASTP
jgi:tetratricopeptide (TPR) repeat protein